MRIQFGTRDSIYKIFKTIRKIPSYKKVHIFIDPDHEFFSNDRRGKEIRATLLKKNISATFIVKDLKSKRYFEALGASVSYEQPHIFSKLVWKLYQLLFATKELHNSLMIKKNYISLLVVTTELIVIVGVLYLFWWMISPNATIKVKPWVTIDTVVYSYRYLPATGQQYREVYTNNLISVPYHRQQIDYTYTMNVDVANASYTLIPAKGQVRIINTMFEPISLVAGSRLVTEEWLLYTTNYRIEIPAATSEEAGEVLVDVTAADYQENGEPIGERGNIADDTKLYIRNLDESIEQELIWWVAAGAFWWGDTTVQGTVAAQDLSSIEEKIVNTVYTKRKELLLMNFSADQGYVLQFDDLITLEVENFSTDAAVGDQRPYVEGTIDATINFLYVTRDDLVQALMTYLEQRPSPTRELVNIDHNSLTFFDYTYDERNATYLIPTKLNAIRSYNFSEDPNNLIGEIRTKIAWKTAQEAKQLLLQYDEIAQVDIQLSPPRYDTLPQVKSRIHLDVSTQ